MAGIFNSAIFNNAIFNTGEAAPSVNTSGTGGIDQGEGARRNIFKPTGLVDRPFGKAKPPVVDVPRESPLDIVVISEKPVAQMTMPEIDFEIGYLMKKLYRTQEEDLMLLILMAASE